MGQQSHEYDQSDELRSEQRWWKRLGSHLLRAVHSSELPEPDKITEVKRPSKYDELVWDAAAGLHHPTDMTSKEDENGDSEDSKSEIQPSIVTDAERQAYLDDPNNFFTIFNKNT
jgi:hypothetical protein